MSIVAGGQSVYELIHVTCICNAYSWLVMIFVVLDQSTFDWRFVPFSSLLWGCLWPETAVHFTWGAEDPTANEIDSLRFQETLTAVSKSAST